ncbi:hypothetical protein NX059_006195 [Plenodomus lindquistii]|nr:hypothetical protein NX059_006195 [Plenodomus lindquistii]
MSTPDPPRPRTISSGTGCATTFAYPTCGGLIHKYFTEVELQYLGLPLTEPTHCDQDPVAEDAFALRLLSLGARWWRSREYKERWYWKDIPLGFHFPPDLQVGYPSSGGVLVLKLHAGNSTRLEGFDPPARPADGGRVTFAETMDKRCELLKRYGAQAYDDLSQCDDVSKTLEGVKAEGKRYEALLEKWGDPRHLDEWCDNMESMESSSVTPK